MATNDRGLGSDNMSQADKDRIRSMGGQASGNNNSKSTGTKKSDVTTNNSGGGAIDKLGQRKGGHNSSRS